MLSDPGIPIRIVVCISADPDVASLLIHNGFMVWKTKDLEETINVFRKERCHLVVVDYDLIKGKMDGRFGDVFESISNSLCSAPCFVLFGSTIPTTVAESMSKYDISPIGKKGFGEFPNRIRKIIDKNRATGLEIKPWPPEDEKSPILSIDEKEVQWVMSHLLPPNTNKLYIDESKQRKNSIVIRGHVDDLPELLFMKVGRAKRVKQEIDNYSNFIHWRLVNTNYAKIENSNCWLHLDLGGILYTFLGSRNPVETFSLFYVREEFNAIREVLDLLFDTVLKTLYSSASDLLQIPLYDAYNQYLNLAEIINNPLPDIEFGLPDPRQWVLVNREKSNLRKGGATIISQVRTHGDLWGENILVEKFDYSRIDADSDIPPIKMDKFQTWLIDFERAGWGHTFRDFVELEVDILTRLANFEPKDSLDFYELAISLTKSPKILERKIYDRMKKTTVTWLPYWTDHIEKNSEAQKAFKVIDHLRYLATEKLKLRSADAREYYWGLLLDSLFVALNTGIDIQQRKHAAIYASVLAGRLENWESDKWPPDGWKAVEFKDRADGSEKPTKDTDQKEHMV